MFGKNREAEKAEVVAYYLGLNGLRHARAIVDVVETVCSHGRHASVVISVDASERYSAHRCGSAWWLRGFEDEAAFESARERRAVPFIQAKASPRLVSEILASRLVSGVNMSAIVAVD